MKKIKLITILVFIISLAFSINKVNAEVSNGKITVIVSGYEINSTISNVEQYNTLDETKEIEVVRPHYELVSEVGIAISLYADEDIYDRESNLIYIKDELINTIYTDNNGLATFNNLPLGKYRVSKKEIPNGYYIEDDNLYVVLTDYVEAFVEYTINQEDNCSILRVKYDKYDDVTRKTVYGVYTNENIKNYLGTSVIMKDELVGLLTFEEGNLAIVELPKGKYYLKEIYAPFPYHIESDIKNINIEENGVAYEVLLNSPVVESNYTGSLTIIPMYYYTESDKEEIKEETRNMTADELYNYCLDNGYIFGGDLKYYIYSDEEKQSLLYTIDAADEFIVKIEDIPFGYYYIEKECNSETSYDEIENFTIKMDEEDVVLYQGIKEEPYSPAPPLIGIYFYYDDGTIKTEYAQDIIAKENGGSIGAVPNMKYMITDSNNNILIRSMTDESGSAWIPSELFEDNTTYYFTVIDSPIDLNTPAKTPFKYVEGKEINVPIKVQPKYGLKGDLDFNGVIDANDASLLLETYKSENWSSADLPIADMDNNNVIDANDASLILEYYKTH